MKPRIFIGSSTEGLEIANALQVNLEHDSEATVWSQGLFQASRIGLDCLLRELDNFDFGVFVFSMDDITKVRDESHHTVRDNVIFELGLFMGRLGMHRNFVITPRGQNDLHLPSDLLGLIPLEYEQGRQDGNLNAALGPACTRMLSSMKTLGRIDSKVEQDASLNLRYRVVAFTENGMEKWCWIDSEDVAHPLPDSETALFLARGADITSVEQKDLSKFASENMPSIRNAIAKHRANDIFLLYNNVLYYQSSLGYLYKLASWQGYDYGNREVKDWDATWLQALTSQDFDQYSVI